MAGLIILDACVLIALTDGTNTFHADARHILSGEEDFAITALTGAEVMVHPIPAAVGSWSDLLRDLGVAVIPIEAPDMEAIAATRRQSGLKMPDALVLWLALRRNADVATFDQRLAAQVKEHGLTVLPR